MTGEALQRAPEILREAPYTSLLELFAAVLTGRVRDDALEEISELVSRARSSARAATSRIPLGREETLALRLIYKETRAVRDRSAAVVPGDAISALQQIPRRQRAAVLLSVSFDMPPEEVSVVIGVRPTAVEAILNAGLASLGRLQDAGIDSVRVVRMQARALVAQSEPDAEPQPSRLPRAVVRTLVAPVLTSDDGGSSPDEVTTHRVKLSPVEVLVGSPAAAPIAPPVSSKPRLRPAEALRKLALVAAIVMILLAIFLPASAGDRTPSIASAPSRSAPAAQRVAVAPAPIIPVAVVRPGDSLWRIAEQRLANPLRWPEIWRLNRGLEMTHGRRFERPDLIHPGWRLKLPKR
jgi:sigma-70-like protein/LysM domain-containing protein